MEPSELENLLKKLSIITRAIKLYPEGNPMLAELTLEFFEAVSRTINAKGAVRLKLDRGNFIFDGKPLARDNRQISALALDFYARGITSLTFTEGLSISTLEIFLKLLILEPEELRQRGGISSLIWEANLEGIQITELAHEKLENENDLTLEALFEQVIEIIKQKGASSTRKDLILNLLQERDVLPAFFSFLSRKTENNPDKCLELTLSSIDVFGVAISHEFPDMASNYFRNLAEAVSSLPSLLLYRVLKEYIYQESVSIVRLNIFNQYSVPEIAAVISIFLNHEPKAVRETVRFLQRLDLTNNAIVETFNLIKNKLRIEIDFQHELQELLTGESAGNEKESSFDLEVLEEAANDVTGKVAPHELNRLSREEELAPYSLETLIELILLEQEQENLERVFKLVEDILSALLIAGKFSLALKLIDYLNHSITGKLKNSAEVAALTRKAYLRVSSKETVLSAFEQLASSVRDSEKYSEALSVLNFLDSEIAIETLLEQLETEEQKSRRSYLINVLAILGRTNFAPLTKKLLGGAWYVTRNIVNILGKVGDNDVVPYLEQAYRHPEARVRLEVMQSLRKTRASRKLPTLYAGLSDTDQGVKDAAIIAVGEARDPGSAYIIKTKILNKTGSQSENISTRKLALEALKNIGTRDALEELKKHAEKKSSFFSAQESELQRFAKSLLSQSRGAS